MSHPHAQGPEWATRIRSLVDRLNVTQAALADRLGVSPASVSRWIQGRNEPTPEAYVALGNLAGLPDGAWFWARAGVDPSALPETDFRRAMSSHQLSIEDFDIIAGQRVSGHLAAANVVAIPLLRINAYADESAPAQTVSLAQAEIENVLTAPLDWCPHPDQIVSMHVAGESMFPTIPHGAIIVIDTASTERDQLHGKIVVVAHRDHGFKVARLQRLSNNCYLLVSSNHKILPVDITNASKWKVFGEVLWWVSRDTEAHTEH